MVLEGLSNLNDSVTLKEELPRREWGPACSGMAVWLWQEDEECPRVAPGWEFPGEERDFPRQAPTVHAGLGGCWEAGRGTVVLWVFWLVGVSVAWGFCRELPPEQVPGDTVLFQDLPLSQAHPGSQRVG